MLCEICHQNPEAVVRYDNVTFVDGRHYEIVCHTCSAVPKSWEYDPQGEIIYYGYLDPNRLATIEQLKAEGWAEEVAAISVAAVEKAVKNIKFNIRAINHNFIFDRLYGLDVELSW